MIIHTASCVATMTQLAALREAYQLEWPLLCRTCSGTGGTSYSENVGERNYPIYERGFEPCPECYGQGLCPRCRSSIDVENVTTCMSCGWREGTTGPPSSMGCACWLVRNPDKSRQNQIELSDDDEKILDEIWKTIRRG